MSGLKINFGECNPKYKDQGERGWVTVDRAPGAAVTWDLRRLPYPFADGAAEMLYTSHFIEHLLHADARRFLGECLRILQPGGVLRVVWPEFSYSSVVPQMALLEYLSGARVPGGELNEEERFVLAQCHHTHLYAYDLTTMRYELCRAGFTPRLVLPLSPGKSSWGKSEPAELDNLGMNNLCVEAKKAEA